MKNNFQNNISKEELDLLPLNHFKGEIVLVDNMEILKQVIGELYNYNYIGFDTETRPTFVKGQKKQ